MKPTEEQEAFVQELLAGRPCFLSARAGTGKTSTILFGVQRLLDSGYPAQEISVVAFNKANQEDLARKLPKAVRVSTLHSLGFAATRRYLTGAALETDKLFQLVSEAGIRGKHSREIFRDTMRLVSAAKSQGIVPQRAKLSSPWKEGLVPDNAESWLELVEKFELWDADIEKAREILKQSNEQALKKRIIDFDDMVYLPIALGLKILAPERLIVDEAQDLSPLNIAMLKSVLSKIWYVGDPFQTIYAWRGAESNTVESLGLPVLPLTNCWRCSGEIIREAKKLVPDIRTENPAGPEVQELREEPEWEALAPATILARRNSNLIALALKLRNSRTKVCIFGRDFAKTLESILDKLKGTNSKALKESLRSWTDKMIAKYPHQEGELKDYQVSLDSILSEVSGTQAAKKLLEDMFTDSPQEGTWILSTIHKAKGKEWPRVYLLEWEPKGEQGWQKTEERNLKYVAITRAQTQLIKVLPKKTVELEATLRSNTATPLYRDEIGDLYRGSELLSSPTREDGLWD